MGRRTWIKLYSNKVLRGSIRQEDPIVRSVFFDLLAMAADSAYGDSGIIKLADDVGFTDGNISGILNISLDIWKKAKKRLSDHPKPKENRIRIIPLKQDYAIEIINWKKYQSEYERQKKTRKKPEKKEVK